jgi:hypothetical protein
MVVVHENDRFRSKITGSIYEVEKIVNEMIVLKNLNGKSQVLTEFNNLVLFYERELARVEDHG